MGILTKLEMDQEDLFPLPNEIENPDYVPEDAYPQIPIEAISVTDLNTTFFEEVRKISTQHKSCRVLFQLITSVSQDNSLINSFNETWKESYDEGRFHLIYGAISHRTKHTGLMTVVDMI
ncbi:hypothetical protein O181_009003 [Austropuccinia psidii MF-1]|uniref:Uncharacterized protein n=1 Tax=Austropuccinia psidii MF-1 TaxID=1389203 RepID=A0A9Q3BQI6_9BASI|nr:hypothetical protein [Austropuccinia psidii MF-1]